MPITWRVDAARGLLRATLAGDCPLGEMQAMLAQVASDPPRRPLRVLSDHRTLSTPITPAQAQALVEQLTAGAATFGGGRWAVVVGSAASFGMIRMLGALLDPIDLAVEPFQAPEEAEAWVLDAPPPAAG